MRTIENSKVFNKSRVDDWWLQVVYDCPWFPSYPSELFFSVSAPVPSCFPVSESKLPHLISGSAAHAPLAPTWCRNRRNMFNFNCQQLIQSWWDWEQFKPWFLTILGDRFWQLDWSALVVGEQRLRPSIRSVSAQIVSQMSCCGHPWASQAWAHAIHI